MPTFDTPGPISVTVELGVGELRIVASDRTDTVVDVRPGDPTRRSDVTSAEQTRVEHAGGRLLVRAPRGWRPATLRAGGESIVVQIELPTGSDVRGVAGVVALHCTGSLGACRYKTGAGDIHVTEAGPVELRTAAGDITVEHVVGDALLTTGSGAVRLDRVEGTAAVKNANGDTWIGEVAGDVRVRAANGQIVVERARAAVDARTANGDVRLGAVTRGVVEAQTAFGKVDIGVHEGTAAWLDLDTRFGVVHSDLEATDGPADTETVEVRARTSFGDITVRRAPAPRATR